MLINIIDERAENRASSANCAIGDHDWLATNRILHLVMITDNFNGIRFGFSLHHNTDYQFMRINFIFCCTNKIFMFGLVKHFFGKEFKVEHEKNDPIK